MRDEGDEPGSHCEPGGRGDPGESEPAVAAAPPPTRRHTRRWFLAAAGAVLVGAGGGVGAAFARRPPRPVPHRPPQPLVDAYAAEQRLIDSAAATARADSAKRAVLAQLRRDHAAHLAALRAQLSGYDHPSRAARRRAAASAGRLATSTAALSAAEADAAGRAAARANQLAASHPITATLLASIAACESGHFTLLE